MHKGIKKIGIYDSKNIVVTSHILNGAKRFVYILQ